MTQVRDLPPPSDAKFLERVREELQRLMGTRGQDPALRRSDTGSLIGGWSSTIVLPGGGPGGGSTPDLTPPPSPTFGTGDVSAGFTQVIVTWAGINYTQGNGNKQTIIYAVKKDPSDATLPTFPGDAGIVAVAPHALTIMALPSEPNTRWHIWLKFETNDGVQSASPSGGVNGVSVTTGQDIEQLLDVLTGEIRESHLYRALAEPIRSIIRRADDAAEDALRAAMAAHQSAQRAKTALLAEAKARGTAITQTVELVTSGDAQLASQITTLTAAVETNRAEALSGIETEATARASGDAAEATQRETLATQLRGAYTGTDIAAVTTGLIHSERQARSTADAAQVSRLDTLEATVNNPTTGVTATAAALDVVEATVNNGTSGNTALASRTSTLEATVNTPTSGNNPTFAALQTEASARAALDGSVQALYTLRAEVSSGGRTMIGGFGLSATATAGAGPRIDFGVRADQFYIGAPAGSGIADTFPLVVRTTVTTENGVTIPAGVYIDSAYIVNVSALYGRFGTLVADSISAASINVSQLVAGSLAVGAYAQSTGFVSGISGWRISGNGNAEFSGIVARGTIIATAGSIGGNAIDSTGMQSPGYSAGSTGWRLDTTGLVRAFALAGDRVLDMAATGTAPVLKIGSALELLANGDAFFGGRLAVGSVSTNGKWTGSVVLPSLPNSTATFNTGVLNFSPAATLNCSGGNLSAVASVDVRVAAESTSVESIRVFGYLYRNGTEVDSSELFMRTVPFFDPTGARRLIASEMTLIGPLEALTGSQQFTYAFSVNFYDASGTQISPGPSAFTSYLQVVARINLQEIKV